jgi:hypothetical protein
MPQVGFTLDEVRTVVREEIRGTVGPMIGESELLASSAVQQCFEDYAWRFDRLDELFDGIDARLDGLIREVRAVRGRLSWEAPSGIERK